MKCFLDLPLELRLMVLRWALDTNEDDDLHLQFSSSKSNTEALLATHPSVHADMQLAFESLRRQLLAKREQTLNTVKEDLKKPPIFRYEYVQRLVAAIDSHGENSYVCEQLIQIRFLYLSLSRSGHSSIQERAEYQRNAESLMDAATTMVVTNSWLSLYEKLLRLREKG